PREALAREAGVCDVDHVMRGGFFGGRTAAIPTVAADYRALLQRTLDAGLMGTEESLFTILAFEDPDRFTCYRLGGNGLLGPFFDAVVNGTAPDRRLTIERRLPPPAPAPPVPRLAIAFPPEVPDEATKGFSQYMGVGMMQNRYALVAFQA